MVNSKLRFVSPVCLEKAPWPSAWEVYLHTVGWQQNQCWRKIFHKPSWLLENHPSSSCGVWHFPYDSQPEFKSTPFFHCIPSLDMNPKIQNLTCHSKPPFCLTLNLLNQQLAVVCTTITEDSEYPCKFLILEFFTVVMGINWDPCNVAKECTMGYHNNGPFASLLWGLCRERQFRYLQQVVTIQNVYVKLCSCDTYEYVE